MNIKIYDTEGSPGGENLYEQADCCLLVYDITNRNSFDECKHFYNNNIKKKCKRNIKVILLGNKTDLEDKRQVIYEEAVDFAYENNYIYMESSCLENENVSEAFETLIGINDDDAKKTPKGNYILKVKKHNKSLNKYLSC